MSRLIDIEELSNAQKRILDRILAAEGECACGAIMSPLSAKFVLGNLVSMHPVNNRKRGGIVMAAYCTGCFTRINNLLKAISAQGKMGGQNA